MEASVNSINTPKMEDSRLSQNEYFSILDRLISADTWGSMRLKCPPKRLEAAELGVRARVRVRYFTLLNYRAIQARSVRGCGTK